MINRLHVLVWGICTCFIASNTLWCLPTNKLVSAGNATQKQSISIQLKDYVLVVSKKNGYAIKEATLEAKRLDPETIRKISTAHTWIQKGNTLVLKTRKAKKAGHIDVTNFFPNEQEQLNVVYVGMLFILFAGLCVLFFLFLKRKNKRKEMIPTKMEHFLYQRIVSLENTCLTIHELDALLEIDKLSTDSKKLKRHRLINELNSYYPGLIRREKDLTDKRRNIYHIQKGQS
jgi:hypothetical protein